MEHSSLKDNKRDLSEWVKIGMFTLLSLCIYHEMHAQSRYLTFGTGATPMTLSGDYRAMGWNPGQMSFSPLNHESWKSTVGGLEIGARLSSEALNRSDIWDGILNRNETNDTWDVSDWNGFIDLIANESIDFNAEALTAGSAKHLGSWVFAYSNTQHFQAEAFFDQTPLELLVQGGSDLWTGYFDQLITVSGDTIMNSGEFTAEELLNFSGGVNLNGDAIISDLLGTSRLGFSWQRCHSVGVSKAWKLGSLRLHTGVSGRIILGNGFFQLKNTENGLDAFGAFSNGFGLSNIASIATGGVDNIDDLRQWGPVGQGWGLDVGGVLEWEDKAWVSASVSDLGEVEWRGERYSVNTSLNSWSTPVSNSTSITSIVVGAMNPNTWFEEAEFETRVIPNGATFHVGGGLHLNRFFLIAGEMAFDNPDLIGNSGTRFGGTLIFEPLRYIRGDIGLSKWGDQSMRVPAGILIKTGKRGYEFGIQSTDIQAIWKASQPELGFRAVAMRWIW